MFKPNILNKRNTCKFETMTSSPLNITMDFPERKTHRIELTRHKTFGKSIGTVTTESDKRSIAVHNFDLCTIRQDKETF